MPSAGAVTRGAEALRVIGGVGVRKRKSKRGRFVTTETHKKIDGERVPEERRTCTRFIAAPLPSGFKPTPPFAVDEDENVWEADCPVDNLTRDEWMRLRAMTSCFEDQGVDFAISEATYGKLCDRRRKVCYFCAAEVAGAPWLVLRGDADADAGADAGADADADAGAGETDAGATIHTAAVYKATDVDVACGPCWFKARGRTRAAFLAHALACAHASAEPWSAAHYGDIATAQAIKDVVQKEVLRARARPLSITLKVTDAGMRAWQATAHCSLCGAPPSTCASEGLTRVHFPDAIRAPAGGGGGTTLTLTLTLSDVEARCPPCFNFFKMAGGTDAIVLGCGLIARHTRRTQLKPQNAAEAAREDDEFACDTMTEDFFERLISEDDCACAESCPRTYTCGKVHGVVPPGAEVDAAFLHSLQSSACRAPERCPLSIKVLEETYGRRERYPTSRVQKVNALLPWSLQNVKATCRGCSADEGTPFDDYVTYLKQSVEVRGKAFDLTRETFDGMRRKPCHYCGRPPSTLRLNGIDRVANASGYVDGNCVPCCARCNRWKFTYSDSQFISQCARVCDHFTRPSSPRVDG
jgi:ribosomal protein S14